MDDRIKAIEEYQQVVQKSWNILKSLKGQFEIQALQEFLDVAFRAEILDIYAGLKNLQVIDDKVVEFHTDLAKDIFESGN